MYLPAVLLLVISSLHVSARHVTSPVLHIVTYATLPNAVLDVLKSTLKRKGCILYVMGEGQGATGWAAGGQFGFKLSLLHAFVYGENIKPNDVILAMDAYDTYFNGDPAVLLSRFVNHFDTPIVFSAEKSIHDRDRHLIANHTEDARSRFFPYMNAGVFMGRAYALRMFLDMYEYDKDSDDQLWWMTRYLNHPLLISLDHDCMLFFNSIHLNENGYSISGDVVTFQNSTPQIFHASGHDKSALRPLINFHLKTSADFRVACPVVKFYDFERPKLYIYTFAALSHSMLDLLKSTLSRKGTTLHVGEAAAVSDPRGRSGQRLFHQAKFVKSHKLNPNDVVLFLDPYDTYFNGEPAVLLERFLKHFDRPIVFSAAKHAPNGYETYYPNEVVTQHIFPYLSTSLYIGRVDALRKIFKGLKPTVLDEHLWWTKLYFSCPGLIGLDHWNQLFFNSGGMTADYYMIEGEWVGFLNRTPLVFHANGEDKLSLLPLIRYGMAFPRMDQCSKFQA